MRYWIPATSETPLLYPDYALAAPVDSDRTLATDPRLALEVYREVPVPAERRFLALVIGYAHDIHFACHKVCL